MVVLVFRHGPAGESDPSRWPDDAARPLTPQGIEKTRRAARGLARLLEDARPRILSSPLVRADETAKILAQTFQPPLEVTILEALAPGGTVKEVLARLTEEDARGTVVLVGHQPGLGRLAGSLAFGAGTELPLKKAGALAIAFVGKPALGRGELHWLATPRMLRALGKKIPA